MIKYILYRAYVKVLEFQDLCITFCNSLLFDILIVYIRNQEVPMGLTLRAGQLCYNERFLKMSRCYYLMMCFIS